MGKQESSGQLLKSGAMAAANGISKRALRLYIEKGLLKPNAMDEETGYCYFDIMQSSKIDLISHLQLIGLSLDDIREIDESKDIEFLRKRILDALGDIEEKQRALAMAERVAASSLASCDTVINAPLVGQIMIETLPSRAILEFSISPDDFPNGSWEGLSQPQQWEWMMRSVKQHIVRNGWPVALFKNMGCVISADKLLAPGAWRERAFVLADESFGACFQEARHLPGGQHLVIYRDGSIDPPCNDQGDRYIRRLLDYAEAKGFEATGDLLIEAVCNFQHLFDPKTPSLHRYCLSVTRKR